MLGRANQARYCHRAADRERQRVRDAVSLWQLHEGQVGRLEREAFVVSKLHVVAPLCNDETDDRPTLAVMLRCTLQPCYLYLSTNIELPGETSRHRRSKVGDGPRVDYAIDEADLHLLFVSLLTRP